MAPHSPEGQCARGARHKLIRRAPPGFVRRSCGPGWRGPGRHDWGPPGAVATTSPMSTSLPSCASATQEHAGTLAFELDDVRSLRALRAVLDWGKRHISRRSAFEQSSEHSISPPRAAMATKRKQDARRVRATAQTWRSLWSGSPSRAAADSLGQQPEGRGTTGSGRRTTRPANRAVIPRASAPRRIRIATSSMLPRMSGCCTPRRPCSARGTATCRTALRICAVMLPTAGRGCRSERIASRVADAT
jgi:hypothetical protein